MSSKHLQFIICSKLLDQTLLFIHIFSMQIHPGITPNEIKQIFHRTRSNEIGIKSNDEIRFCSVIKRNQTTFFFCEFELRTKSNEIEIKRSI